MEGVSASAEVVIGNPPHAPAPLSPRLMKRHAEHEDDDDASGHIALSHRVRAESQLEERRSR